MNEEVKEATSVNRSVSAIRETNREFKDSSFSQYLDSAKMDKPKQRQTQKS